MEADPRTREVLELLARIKARSMAMHLDVPGDRWMS